MADLVAIQAELVSNNNNNNNQATQEDGVIVQPSGPSIHTTSSSSSSSDSMTSNSKTNHVQSEDSNNNENLAADDDDDDDFVDFWNVDGASFWDLLASLSMLFLWFQRSTFGILYLLRSLVVGHCLGRLFDWALPCDNNDNANRDSTTASDTHDPSSCSSMVFSDWMGRYLTLLQSILLPGGNGHKLPLPSPLSPSLASGSSTSSSQTQQPWPPPALVALAILTIVALVVHPDGMTWILLHKIRDTMVTILHLSTTCWATLVRDYGVMGTVSASASIALVLLLAIAMHKAFLSNGSREDDAASNRRRHASAAEKKRRKRKGHAHTKGSRGGNRIKGASSPSVLCPRLPKVEEVASDGACDSSSSRSYNSNEISRMTSSIEDSSLQSSSQAPIGSIRLDSFESKDNIFIRPRIDSQVSASSCFVSQEEEGASIMTSPSALESVVSSEEYERVPSVPSVCTVDTAAMSDDISCGSFSVRSGPTRQSNSRVNTANNNNTSCSKPNNSNNTRGGKTNKLNYGPTHPKATGGRVNHQAARSVTTRVDGPKVTTNSTKYVSMSSSEGRFGSSSNRSKNRGPGGGKAHFGNHCQNSRTSRGKGGRPHQQKSPKNYTPYRTESPQPTTMNQTMISVTPSPKIGTTILSMPSSSSMHCDNSNRMPPASPFTQSLFSCEGGASGWSLPALPAVNQTRSPTVAPTFPAMSYQTNSFVAPYSRLPAETNISNASVGGTSGLWYSDCDARSSSFGTNNFATPQRPLRAPPGLAPPPGLESVVTPAKLSAPPHLYTPIRTSAMDDNAPSLVPVTPLFGTPTSTNSNEASPFSWSNYGLDGVGSPMGRRPTIVNENPFAFDAVRADSTDDAECRIEAELQELGGRMIGSVLDF